ncbi:hypothetical protein Zm00014a_015960 [Zea mays]|uniref:Helitron helicase-like domain-containing protein n=1 Tax=Zea mays TaxID=4577 RepID=A0A3L6FVD3_MAIZE|nr:hypothetical protein Zm00014a_015960 [Zea mays]
MNPLDQPSASAPTHASRYAIPFHSQQVRRKRPGDKSLLDFPATLATANRQHRIQKMRRTLASAEQGTGQKRVCCCAAQACVQSLLQRRSINNGTTPYVFKINGVVHHRIGSLLPSHGLQPQFAQLYIYDTEHEVQNRLGMFENETDVHDRPDPEVARLLLNMLDEHNKLVAAFRFAKERLDEEGNQKFKYDVLVHARDGGLKHVSCLHPSYMALQYPLLFPYGDRGYHLGIKYSDVGGGDVSCRKYVTMLEFVRHRSHYRLNEPNPFTCYGRLSN